MFKRDSWLRGVYNLSGDLTCNVAAFIICEYCKTVRTLYPLYERQWVDVSNTTGDAWWDAQIKTVGDGWAYVHYKGCKSHHDEIIHTPSPRLAVLHTYTPSLLLDEVDDNEKEQDSQNMKRPIVPLWFWDLHQQFASGEYIVLSTIDSIGNRLDGVVIGIDRVRDGRMLHIHYDGWEDVWDEWINEESDRFALNYFPV